MLLPGPTGASASTAERLNDGTAPEPSTIWYAPRPCEPAAISRGAASKWSGQIDTVGRPVPNGPQLPPPLYVTNEPTSVPTYSVFGYDGSTTTVLTGTSGRLPLMSMIVWPPSS